MVSINFHMTLAVRTMLPLALIALLQLVKRVASRRRGASGADGSDAKRSGAGGHWVSDACESATFFIMFLSDVFFFVASSSLFL